jgi:hypothetical protein
MLFQWRPGLEILRIKWNFVMNRRLPHVAETVSTTGIIGSNFTWHIDVSESLSYVGLCFPVG